MRSQPFGEAHVDQLGVATLVDERVLGLQVSVDDAFGVHVLQAAQK